MIKFFGVFMPTVHTIVVKWFNRISQKYEVQRQGHTTLK